MRKVGRENSAGECSRGGFILLLVLVVTALLSFAVYSFSHLMVLEATAASETLQQVRRRRLAESGIELATAAVRQRSTGRTAPQLELQLDDGQSAQVLLLQTLPTAGAVLQPGLVNESSRLNLATLPLQLSRRQQSRNRLLALPGVTQPLADAILDWMDEDNDPSEFGAEASWYLSQSPPRLPRNGVFQDLHELLQVRGMTSELLYGEDQNANGVLDPEENDGTLTVPSDNRDGVLQGGLYSMLTLVSAEASGADQSGCIHINDNDLAGLYDRLQTRFGSEAALFVVAGRMNGINWLDDLRPDEGEDMETRRLERLEQAEARLNAQLGLNKTEGGGQASSSSRGGLLLTGRPVFSFRSLVDLFGGEVRATVSGEDRLLRSPWPSDPATVSRMLPEFERAFALTAEPVIRGRINVNCAAAEVLATIPGISESAARSIRSLQPRGQRGLSPEAGSVAWLLSRGLVTMGELRAIAPLVTTGGDVFSGFAVGQIVGQQPVAVIRFTLDAASQTPQLLQMEDLPVMSADLLGLQ